MVALWGLRPVRFSGIVWREVQPVAAIPPSDILPQLVMRFDRFDALPQVELPEGYALHTLAERGEREWTEALNATGELGEWDDARARGWMEGDHRVIPDGSYMVVFEGRTVATTCLVTPRQAGAPVEVGWVSVSPDHQGRGLGYQVTLAVLLYAGEMGWSAARLWTDDWRLPAIKTYLNLGFEPDVEHESHPERWRAVFEKLGNVRPRWRQDA